MNYIILNLMNIIAILTICYTPMYFGMRELEK